ncbi:MAG: hypothetical protein KatS3mg115_2631 [Candidatus Poribacteria bacterium]|nr:MAG: hypothetical protein KatS3mg115_2631 [Candidatus Poribacteria bacterium]
MAVYAAMIDRMDQGIGRIVRALRQHGMEENTLIFFLSDNGGCAEYLREDGPTQSGMYPARDGKPVRIGNIRGLEPGGPHTFMSYDRPWANASNTPFRLYKHWVHEGGISTPCLAYWPGVVPPRSLSHQPVHVIDLLPTLLEAAGAPYPPHNGSRHVLPLEGQSLLPLLRGERWEREGALFWEHEGNQAVRLGRWKLVRQYPGNWELYDMEEDRTELNDLANSYPDVVQHLSELYREWAERCQVLPWERLQEIRRQRRQQAKG